MEPSAAAEHLQVIRTLMERSALYRRTLAPIMLYLGAIGSLACLGGLAFEIDTLAGFYAWWLTAAVLGLAGAFLIVRRQAMRDGEPFWSPPTLRVTEAMAPPLAAGLVLSLALPMFDAAPPRGLFVLANALFYGCAVHAAGFFMPRGMKLFGWIVILLSLVGSAGLAVLEPAFSGSHLAHGVMGCVFGLLHLAYGAYLYATERRGATA
ncbi:MAG: hypothetical protein ACE148_13025 [Vicinamibacterales bacterium]